MRAGTAARAGALAVALATIGSCASPGTTSASVVEVLAAASLTEAFGEMGRLFEQGHPGADVRSTFAASSTLARQIEAGAPADVFVSADEATMQALVDEGHVTRIGVAAANRLRLAVAPGNPLALSGLADLARPGLVVVLCAPTVPCGRLAALALRRAGVAVEPESLEANVKAVVSRVVLGEADAGVVYATDVLAAGRRVTGLDLGIPDDPTLHASYPIAVASRTSNPRAGRAFVELVLSPAGRRVLARHGFVTP